MPGVRSASIGIWVGVGSRDETEPLAGASHFLEHVLFKGTRTRSPLDISAPIEAVGGELNAFTGKEYTCYHARVLDADLPLAIDILADMVTSSVVSRADVESEREVILEEIAMNDDDPDDVVHNLIASRMWASSPLGRPVSGTRRVGRAADPRPRWRATTAVATGRSRWWWRSPATSTTARWSAGCGRVRRPAGFLDDSTVRARPARSGGAGSAATARVPGWSRRPTEQANVVLGLPGLRRGDDRRFTAGVLNCRARRWHELAAVPGGPREARPGLLRLLVTPPTTPTAACSASTPGARPARSTRCSGCAASSWSTWPTDGLTDEEFRRGRGQLRGGMVLGLEDSGARMARIGKADLVHGELLSLDEVLARIDAVTLDDVRALAADLLGATPALAVVGPFDDADRFTAAVA